MCKLDFEKTILRIMFKWFSDTHRCLSLSESLSSEELINHKYATRVETWYISAYF